MSTAYDRVTFRGVTINKRTRDMLLWAEQDCGIRLTLAQGSYNRGGVAASAGTHDGGGVVDIAGWGVSKKDRRKILRSLKRAGFAAWFRSRSQGFDPHFHACAFGDKDMAGGARAQLASFDRGRDGLAYDRPDPNPWRPRRKRRWNYRLGKPVRRIR